MKSIIFRLSAYVFLIAVIALGFTSTKASTVTSEERTENQHAVDSNQGVSQVTPEAIQTAEKQLAQIYQQVMSRINPEEREKLKKAQIQWIKNKELTMAYFPQDAEKTHLQQVMGRIGFLSEQYHINQKITQNLKQEIPPKESSQEIGKPEISVQNNALQGVGEDGNLGKINWSYEFVPVPSEKKVILTSDEKSRKVYSNQDWIVTSEMRRLGDGVGESLVSFWNAKSLKKEFQLRVPNGVQHLDWSTDRKQFLLVTGKGFKWSLGGSHQALVLIDPAKKQLELIKFNKKPDNAVEDHFDIQPVFWGNSPQEISVNGEWNAIASLAPGATIKPQTPAFKDLKIKVIQSPLKQQLSSLDEHDSSGLNFLGIELQKPSQKSDESVVLYAEKTIADGDKKNTRILRSPDNGKLLNMDLHSLKMEVYHIPFANVEQFDNSGFDKRYLNFGFLNNQEIYLENSKGISRISHNAIKNIPLPKALFPPPNQPPPDSYRTQDASYAIGEDSIYVGTIDLKKDHPLLIQKITVDGKSTNTVNQYDAANLKIMGGLGVGGGQFTIYPERKSFSVKLGNEGVWHEYSWVDGKEISPSHQDNARSVYFRKYGIAPEGWEISRSLDEAGAGFADYSVQVRNLTTGQSFKVANGPNVGSSPLVLEISGNKTMTLISGASQAELATLDLKNGKTTSMYKWNWVSPRGQNFHVDGSDGLALYDPIKKWLFIPSDKGFSVFGPFGPTPSQKLFDLLFEGHDQFVIVLPNGFYAGSPGCEKLLKLPGKGGVIDSFSLAPWKNRPAEVIKALGGDPKDADLLGKVTERWLKRIGFDPTTPEPAASEIAKVSVPQMPPLWAKDSTVSFPIEATAGSEPLKEVAVRVNGVLQKSFSGSELNVPKGRHATLTASVNLAEGQNWIEVTATDAKGRPGNLEHFRTILPKASETPKRYIVAMGCSDYDRPELHLQFAAKDAGDVLKTFSEAGGRECKTLLLTNKDVGPEALDKIKAFLGDSKESDEVILFCAGHGLLDEHLDYVYAGHQIDPAHPGQTGIKLDALLESISSGKSLKRLVLMDTCQSGSVGEQEEMKLAKNTTELPRGVRAIKNRGLKVVGTANLTGGDQQRFIEEMFLLPGQHRGINIIGASGGAEYAMESDKWNNGVFTSALIEGLRDQKADMDHRGRISVGDLKTYLAQRVPELTGGAQKPSVVAFEQDQNFDLVGHPIQAPKEVKAAKTSINEEALDAKGQYELAARYQIGSGVTKDPSKAEALLKKSADRGNVDAEFALGVWKFRGVTPPKNEVEGKRWIQRAADHGNEEAQSIMKLSELEAALKADPKNRPLLAKILQSYIALGMLPELDKTISNAISVTPNDIPFLRDMINLYATQQFISRALDVATKLQQVQPDQWDVPYTIAKFQLLLGQKDKAYGSLHQAINLGGSSVQAQIQKEPLWNPVKSDPAFKKAIKLPKK